MKKKKDRVGDDEVLSRVRKDRNCSHQISEDSGNVEGFFTLINVDAGKGSSTADIVQVEANTSVYSFTPDSTREQVLNEARR
jgi:hypothetical protein